MKTIARAFYGAGGFACFLIAWFGMGIENGMLRLAAGFLGIGLFLEAFRPPKKGEGV